MSLEVSLAQDLHLVFNVPLLLHTVPDAAATNAGLERLIRERERRSAGLRISDAGGWHSEETLLDWPEPEIAALRGWIDSAVQRISRLPARQNPEAVRLAYRARRLGQRQPQRPLQHAAPACRHPLGGDLLRRGGRGGAGASAQRQAGAA